MKIFNRKKNQRGFTFIELMIAVVIFGVFASYVIPMLTGIKDKNVTVTQEAGAMDRTVKQIFIRYANEPVDGTFDNASVIRGKLQAEAYRTSGTNIIYNIFGGKITITGVADNGLIWQSELIPTQTCSSMVFEAKRVGFETVDISGTVLTYSTDNNDAFATACDSVAGDFVTVIWTKKSS